MSVETQIEELKARLVQETGCQESDVQVVYSPLRISPLGAHVDHQDGLVTGMTLDRAILLAFVPRTDDRVRVQSLNFPHEVEFALSDIPPRVPRDWGNYVRGAALALQQNRTLSTGIDAIVQGRMPIGGLSSSAAVGVAYLLALETANELEIPCEENIQLDRYIENEYQGLMNGILDQSIILMSDWDHLTFLDCQTVEFAKYRTAATRDQFEILVVYSGLARSLIRTDYNTRVEECEQAARQLLEWAQEPVPETPRLRMVGEEIYARFGERLPAPLDRRARHFFTELDRVRQGVIAWEQGDLERMGRLINESGASSIENYQCGCQHLITLYRILRQSSGVFGARFSGGGFRGSCIALIDPDYREEIKTSIATEYPQAHPDVAELYSIHVCRPDGPARLWE
ncbi:MAG: galactokinase family protein [Anaerolineae bacterium]